MPEWSLYAANSHFMQGKMQQFRKNADNLCDGLIYFKA